MIAELPYAVMVSGTALLGLYMSNVAFDYHMPQYLSRKLGHLFGAAAFLLCGLLFSSFWWPFILALCFTGLLVGARLCRPSAFRGVGGSGRPNALAEVFFPATATVLMGILWGIYDQRWLAIVPLLFMGTGDAVTGLIRARVYGREVKGVAGSIGMLLACLLLAYFVRPYWIGAVGAGVATLAERFTKTTRYSDDNLTIPLSSALAMVLLYLSFGGL